MVRKGQGSLYLVVEWPLMYTFSFNLIKIVRLKCSAVVSLVFNAVHFNKPIFHSKIHFYNISAFMVQSASFG